MGLLYIESLRSYALYSSQKRRQDAAKVRLHLPNSYIVLLALRREEEELIRREFGVSLLGFDLKSKLYTCNFNFQKCWRICLRDAKLGKKDDWKLHMWFGGFNIGFRRNRKNTQEIYKIDKGVNKETEGLKKRIEKNKG